MCTPLHLLTQCREQCSFTASQGACTCAFVQAWGLSSSFTSGVESWLLKPLLVIVTSHLGFLRCPKTFPSRWSFCATWWSSCQSKFCQSCCALTWHNTHDALTTKTMCWSHSCDFLVIIQHLHLGGMPFGPIHPMTKVRHSFFVMVMPKWFIPLSQALDQWFWFVTPSTAPLLVRAGPCLHSWQSEHTVCQPKAKALHN